MSTLVFVDLESSTQVDGAQSSRVPVLLPKDPYEAIRQAYLVGADTESEPFEGKARTLESPHIVAPPTCHVEESEGSVTIARMAVRVPPVMSPGLSASIAEVAAVTPLFVKKTSRHNSGVISKHTAMSDSTFRKRFRSSYDCSSSPILPVWKRYRGTSELILGTDSEEVEESSDSDSESEDVEDEGPTVEDEDPAAEDEGLAARVEGLGLDDESYSLDDESHGVDGESYGLDDESRGIDEEGRGIESDGLGLRHVYSTDIITVDQGRCEKWGMKLTKEVANPRCLSYSICNPVVFSLGTRMRQRVLTFGGPRHETISEVHSLLIEFEKSIKMNKQPIVGASSTPQVMVIQGGRVQKYKTQGKAKGKRKESAARILNMVPTKKVDKTPYEPWHGKVPNLSYLKNFFFFLHLSSSWFPYDLCCDGNDDPNTTTTMNMALALMAKAFKLNYSTPTNNNQRISSNPKNRQIAQPGMNMGQDRQMLMIGGNGGNQFRQYAGQNAGNLNGYNEVQTVGNQVAQNPRAHNVGTQNGLIGVQGNRIQHQIGNGNLVAARAEGNVAGQNANQI
nr:retrotransposon protein, putative, Ty1-copia subclass [Tanacetum cinerariifolium]